MKNLKKCLAGGFAVAALGIALVSCSSPKAETRADEPVVSAPTNETLVATNKTADLGSASTGRSR